MYQCRLDSPFGILIVESDGTHITGLWIEGQKYEISDKDLIPVRPQDLPVFEELKDWLSCYFRGKEPEHMPPLSTEGRGSDFRRRVWEILQEIPYGETVTYGEIAARLETETGRKQSARAVGGAVGHNPISILIPCHRVLGAGGKITGYAGGIDKKIRLLELEAPDRKK